MRSSALSIAGLLIIFACSFAGAQSGRLKIEDRSKEFEKVNEELERKRKERERLERQAEEISRTVQEDVSKIRNIERSVAFTRTKNEEVERRLAKTKNRRDQLLNTRADRETALGYAARTYLASARLSGPTAFVPTVSRQILRRQVESLKSLSTSIQETAESLGSLKENYILYRTELDRQASTLRRLESGKEEHQRRLEKTRTRRQIIESELRELEQTAQELAALIDILRRKEKTAREAEKREREERLARGDAPIAPRSLAWPVAGEIVRSFGRQKHPTLGTPFISNGIIIETTESRPVAVVADGTVLYAGAFMSYGPMTVVEHTGDWFSVYGNMAGWNVEKGQKLKAGETVGWTGVSEEAAHHAYFELRFYGEPTNPAPFLRKADAPAPR